MTIFCDRDNRWYLGFLCGLLLLAVGLGAIFSWQLGQGCTGSACGARRNGGRGAFGRRRARDDGGEGFCRRERAFCSDCCAFGKDRS